MKSDEVRPQSGGAMDRVVEKKGLPQRAKIAIGAGLLALAATGFYAYAPTAESQTVAADRITVSTVTRGRFDDFLPLRARVTPLVTVFLDAVEGGRVEQVLVEDGAMVQQGQLLAVLSNSDLQLNLLARQTEVTQQINSMRSQELALSQNRLQNERTRIEAELAASKARRQFEMQRPLSEKGFVPGKVFRDSQDEAQAAGRRAQVVRQTQATDERLQRASSPSSRRPTLAQRQPRIARRHARRLNIRAARGPAS
jgi:HlyD family secretion protein